MTVSCGNNGKVAGKYMTRGVKCDVDILIRGRVLVSLEWRAHEE